MRESIDIRNLTSLSLTLNSIERQEKRQSYLWENLEAICLCRSLEENSDASDDSRPVETLRVNTKIPPFQTRNVKIEAVAKEKSSVLENELLCLTFTDESGCDYRINISTTSFCSTESISMGNRGPAIIAMYSPAGSLTMFPKRDLKSWMKEHPDTTPLSILSIPGTHNSPTCHKALPSVRCQAVSPKEQLENGVRFLDVRVQVDEPDGKRSDELTLVHSDFSIALSGSKKFKPFYREVLAFLKQNPSETVILSLKREGRGDAKDADLAQRLYDHYVDSDHWVMSSGIPTLGEARGKIVLFRRFNLNPTMRERYGKVGGIDASSWADNTANSKAGDVHIQDFYEVLQTENIEKKTEYILEHCKRAATSNIPQYQTSIGQTQIDRPLFVNFLSASNFWKPGCWPEKIAKKINPLVLWYLCEQHGVETSTKDARGGLGILVCDWVGEDGDWDLVKAIIGVNENLLVKQNRNLRQYGHGSGYGALDEEVELPMAGAARRRRKMEREGGKSQCN